MVFSYSRKTNHDYTHGHLPELIDLIVAEKAKLFICAVGVPPQWAVDKLHAGGVVIANMVGSVRNTVKALDAGVDMIIAQGTEGGGHTGEIGTMCLIPQAGIGFLHFTFYFLHLLYQLCASKSQTSPT